MPNELTVSASISYRDGNGIDGSLQVLDHSVDVASPGMIKQTYTAPIVDSQMFAGGLAGYRWIAIANLDSLNYVQIKPTPGGAYVIKLLAGEVAMFPLDPAGFTDPYVKANTAPVDLAFFTVRI